MYCRNALSEKYKEWAEDVLFVAQMGTKARVATSKPQVTQEQVSDSFSEETLDMTELDDDEEFRDDGEYGIEIEKRRQRTRNGILFRVKDVSSGFGKRA